MLNFTKTQLKTLEKIKDYALNGGGIYRANCATADIYEFDFIKRGHDFEGGWGWKYMLEGAKAKYFRDRYYILLATGEVFENN